MCDGTYVLDNASGDTYEVFGCIQNGSISSITAEFDGVTYGDPCTTPPPTTTTTSTTTSTTTPAPVNATFRVNNTSLITSVTSNVSINDSQIIAPQTCAPNGVQNLTPTVNVSGYTDVSVQFSIVGYSVSSATLYVFPTTYYPSSLSPVTFDHVDLTANENIELTIHP
jgi:hypothetical protein